MSQSSRTLYGLREYYAQRTVFDRGEKPSPEQIAQAIGECHTMIGMLLRLLQERQREDEP